MVSNKIVILGLGREGMTTLHWREKWLESGNWPDQLSEFGWTEKSEIIVADQKTLDLMTAQDREFLLGQKGIKLCLGENYLERLDIENLGSNDVIIKTPGINKRIPNLAKILENGVRLSSATNLFFLLKKGQVIAVTGSKGKSTTSSLIYEILKAGGVKVDLIGNIGKPAMEFLSNDNHDQTYVFEMSSYQLEDFQGEVDRAVLVSFFPDHLDYHGGIIPYFEAKMKLVQAVKAGGKIFYNGASKEIVEYLQKNHSQAKSEANNSQVLVAEKIAFNDGERSKVKGEGMEAAAWLGGEKLVGLVEVRLLGRHNLQNMLAAAEVGLSFGLSKEVICDVLRNFRGLEHRLELVEGGKGVIYYNDAISTTPESSIAAIEAISARYQIGTMLVGGLDRGYQFGKFAEAVLKAGVKSLVIFPETGEKIWVEVERVASEKSLHLPKKFLTNKMSEAVIWATANTQIGEVCLLSNASPSYNLFKNFEDKGKQFKEAVKNLK